MGVWGVGLYQNDTSLDVQDEFKELFRKGKTVREITDKILTAYAEGLDDPEEAPLVWFALADTQWCYGVLLADVREKALEWIEKSLERANSFDDLPLRKKAIKVLENLRQKLNSPQPPAKVPPAVPPRSRLYRCPWNVGDVFAYRLTSDLAKERGIAGRYFLIQKVDEYTWHPGHIVPIVYVKLTKDETLPVTQDEYNQVEYVQTSFTNYEERFFPIDGRRPEEDILEKSKFTYEVDEYGFLPEFRIKLVATSKVRPPRDLIFLGNFPDVKPPKKEFVPHAKINIHSALWKNHDLTFESVMIEAYYMHNKRELSIYRSQEE